MAKAQEEAQELTVDAALALAQEQVGDNPHDTVYLYATGSNTSWPYFNPNGEEEDE